jgi:hypothetical protein
LRDPDRAGFFPRRIQFTDDGSMALLVTQDRISLLRFEEVFAAGPGVAPSVSFDAGYPEPDRTRITFTVDGRYALAYTPPTWSVFALDLQTAEEHELQLDVLFRVDDEGNPDPGGELLEPVEITDLALTADDTIVLAVVERQETMVAIPFPDGFTAGAEPTLHAVKGERFRYVTPVGTTVALLYDRSFYNERLSIVDWTGVAPTRTVDLQKGIDAVYTLDADIAFVVHKKRYGDPNDPFASLELRIDRSYGYTLLRPTTADTRLQLTQTSLDAFVVTPDGGSLLYLQNDVSQRAMSTRSVDLHSFLPMEEFELDSAPVSIGLVASRQTVFVSQNHPDGKLTLIDWVSGDTQTITGLDFSSRTWD